MPAMQPMVSEEDDANVRSALSRVVAVDAVTHRFDDSLESTTTHDEVMAVATSGSESTSSRAPSSFFNRLRHHNDGGHKREREAGQSPLHNDSGDDENDWAVGGRPYQSLTNDRVDRDNYDGFQALGEELHAVSEDLRRKRRTFGAGSFRHNFPDGDLHQFIIDEEDKVKLATRVSQTIGVPGAFSHDNDERLPRPKPSQDQLMEISRLRRVQKNRLSDQDGIGVDHLINSSHDGYHVDALHDTMNALHFHSILENKKSDEEAKRQKRYRRCIIVSAILILVILATIIGVTVGIGRNTNGTVIPPSQPPAEAPSLSPMFDVTPCLFGNKSTTQRFNTIQSIITTEYVDMREPIDTLGSNARASLCWLSDFDLYEIEIAEGREYELIERFVLALIYFHFARTFATPVTDFSGSTWLTPAHVCEWDFIVCDSTTGNVVTGLAIDSVGLSGSIPSELALLTDLISIEFARNDLSGEIPSTIWNMTQLQVINFGPNQLTGTISNDLANLNNLTSFILGSNYFSGSLPKEIRQLTSLKRFEILEMFDLTGPFPDASNLTNLVFGVDITGTFPTYLHTLTKLKDVGFADTLMTGTIPTEFGRLSKLESLELSNSWFNGTIPTELGNLSALEGLEIQFSFFLGNIPSELGGLLNLEILRLDKTDIVGSVPYELCALRSRYLETLMVPTTVECNCCRSL